MKAGPMGRGRGRATGSVLPSWYPRTPLRDITAVVRIKFGSVKLAKKYMKRVAMELQLKATLEKDPSMDYMLFQGVRFAFRIQQILIDNKQQYKFLGRNIDMISLIRLSIEDGKVVRHEDCCGLRNFNIKQMG